jgi:mannonate dehydratase
MAFEKTWRWFGFQKDELTLSDLKQMGIEGVVTALHHIPNGEVWPIAEIMKVKKAIEAQGMRWSVVESLPVSEGIKTKSADWHRLIHNYKESLKNLGQCGIDTVCYNFMPVLDWVRTDLHYKLPSGGEVMYFDFPTFVAFDAFVLKRPGAEKDYPAAIVAKARERFKSMTPAEAEELAYNIIVVTQGFIDGAVDGSTPDYKKVFLELIDTYKAIDRDRLRQHLKDFLTEVIPVAEANGIRLAIHPDDPPFPVLGLPRIVSTKQDLEWITQQVDSISNGITFCTGSLSVRSNDKLVAMIHSFGHRIHFLHLRNNQLLPDGCFHEYGHIHGVVDMYAVMKALLEEQQRRIKEGRSDTRMPLRPDHGIKLLDDYSRQSNPGYPVIGRLKGLAELTGLEMGIEQMLKRER